MNPFPDHRDLYVIVAGVVLGVLLSKAVLGNLAPDVYQQIFQGVTASEVQEAQEVHRQLQNKIMKLMEIDVTETRIEEVMQTISQDELNPLIAMPAAAARRSTELAGLLAAIVLAAGVIMVLETLVGPSADAGRHEIRPAVARLKAVRYVLMALAIAVIIAQPYLWHGLRWLFFLGLLAVALIVGLVPLDSRRKLENV